jgi:hypothetical protein
MGKNKFKIIYSGKGIFHFMIKKIPLQESKPVKEYLLLPLATVLFY